MRIGVVVLMGAAVLLLAMIPYQQHRELAHFAEPLLEERLSDSAEEPVHAAPPSNTEDAVGVYLTSTNVARDAFLSETMSGVLEAGGNAIVFDVKGGLVFFEAAQSPMAEEFGLVYGSYALEEVLKKAQERGLYTIGRFVAIKDAGLVRAHPDTIVKHPQTGSPIGYEFVDPDHPDVLEYNRQILCELAQSGIDEINLDYIRFSTEQVNSLYAFSSEEKSRKVTAFLEMARDAIDDCGPETKLGISTYAILGWNYEVNLRTLGQDVVNWVELVDIISPMAYPWTFAEGAYYNPEVDPGSRNYFLVWNTLEGYKKLIGEEHMHKLRPWIQGYGMGKKGLVDQMQAVTDAGLCGFQVWSANNYYDTTYTAMPEFVRAEGCQ